MRKLKTRNIGPAHPLYNHLFEEGVTQVIIYEENSEGQEVIAQFFSSRAKLDAQKFIALERLNGK